MQMLFIFTLTAAAIIFIWNLARYENAALREDYRLNKILQQAR